MDGTFSSDHDAIVELDLQLDRFVDRLRRDPNYLIIHEAAYRTAVERRGAGGHPIRPSELSQLPDTAVDRFLCAEAIWLRDPANALLMMAVLEEAWALHKDSDNSYDMRPVLRWLGDLVLQNAARAEPWKIVERLWRDMRRAINELEDKD
ncbi:MAG: hypothetical protein GC159_05690 [Phycisphaera sp.]|nr:hypothetical protein [Phycisphaera sp.]